VNTSEKLGENSSVGGGLTNCRHDFGNLIFVHWLKNRIEIVVEMLALLLLGSSGFEFGYLIFDSESCENGEWE